MRKLNDKEIRVITGGMAAPVGDGLNAEIAKKASLYGIDVVEQGSLAVSGGLETTAAFATVVGGQVLAAGAAGYAIGTAINTYTPIQQVISDALPDPTPPTGHVSIAVPDDSGDAIYQGYDERNSQLDYI